LKVHEIYIFNGFSIKTTHDKENIKRHQKAEIFYIIFSKKTLRIKVHPMPIAFNKNDKDDLLNSLVFSQKSPPSLSLLSTKADFQSSYDLLNSTKTIKISRWEIASILFLLTLINTIQLFNLKNLVRPYNMTALVPDPSFRFLLCSV